MNNTVIDEMLNLNPYYKQLEEANRKMNSIHLKFKSERPDETSWEVYTSNTNEYKGLVKYFTANKRFKAYGNIKRHFDTNRYEYHKLLTELMVEAILLRE